jgi:hypothetical protein
MRIFFTTLFITLVFLVNTNIFAQDSKNKTSASTQASISKPNSNDDKIYSKDEVDTPAVVKKFKVHPKLLKGCKNGGTIKFTMVLRKSGQVTNIALENDNSCESFQAEKIITSLEKTKFTPAIKNGVSVSQLKIGNLQLNFL